MSRWTEKSLTQAELKHASVRGGVITFAAQLVKFILNMAVTIWLAHILVPEDFGLVAMVMIIVNFFVLFKDAGFSVATIQQETVTHEQVSLLFWLNALIGLLLASILYFSAPFIVLFFHEPRLLEIVQVLSLVFVLGGLAIQHEALMRRQMRFRGLVVIEVLGLLCAAATAVLLAISGAGYWAMVWMQVVAIVVRVVLLWVVMEWLPSLPSLKVGVRKMAVFGSELTFSNVIQYLSKQSDQILLGWWSGAHALGLYSTAMQMLMLPIRQILAPLTRVAVVTLSRMQSDAVGFRRTFLLLVRIVAYATMPLMASLAVLAEPVVKIFLGNQWLDVIPIVVILACAGWILAVNNTMGWILMARGQGRRMLRWNMMMAPAMLLAFVCALPWGAVGMAWAFLLVIYASRYFHFRYVLAGTAITLTDLCRAMLLPASLSLCLALVGFTVVQLGESLLAWQTLFVSAFGMLLVLLLGLFLLAPLKREWAEIGQLLVSLKERKELS